MISFSVGEVACQVLGPSGPSRDLTQVAQFAKPELGSGISQGYQRTAAERFQFTLHLDLNESEKQGFEDFFNNVTKGPNLPFVFQDNDGTATSCRFVTVALIWQREAQGWTTSVTLEAEVVVTLAPTTQGPTTETPTTIPPTTPEPTTAAPTTPEPTTAAPTTPEPTTAAPTTPEPTTAAPTTPEPTTAAPTTPEPTTAAPTTPEPTTAEISTAAPTTEDIGTFCRTAISSAWGSGGTEPVELEIADNFTGVNDDPLDGRTVPSTEFQWSQIAGESGGVPVWIDSNKLVFQSLEESCIFRIHSGAYGTQEFNHDPADGATMGVLLRWKDAENYLFVTVSRTPLNKLLAVLKWVKNGVETTLDSKTSPLNMGVGFSVEVEQSIAAISVRSETAVVSLLAGSISGRDVLFQYPAAGLVFTSSTAEESWVDNYVFDASFQLTEPTTWNDESESLVTKNGTDELHVIALRFTELNIPKTDPVYEANLELVFDANGAEISESAIWITAVANVLMPSGFEETYSLDATIQSLESVPEISPETAGQVIQIDVTSLMNSLRASLEDGQSLVSVVFVLKQAFSASFFLHSLASTRNTEFNPPKLCWSGSSVTTGDETTGDVSTDGEASSCARVHLLVNSFNINLQSEAYELFAGAEDDLESAADAAMGAVIENIDGEINAKYATWCGSPCRWISGRISETSGRVRFEITVTMDPGISGCCQNRPILNVRVFLDDEQVVDADGIVTVNTADEENYFVRQGYALESGILVLFVLRWEISLLVADSYQISDPSELHRIRIGNPETVGADSLDVVSKCDVLKVAGIDADGKTVTALLFSGLNLPHGSVLASANITIFNSPENAVDSETIFGVDADPYDPEVPVNWEQFEETEIIWADENDMMAIRGFKDCGKETSIITSIVQQLIDQLNPGEYLEEIRLYMKAKGSQPAFLMYGSCLLPDDVGKEPFLQLHLT